MVRSLIPALLVVVTLCTGCDAFRKLAGRPTSDVIDARRAEIVRIQELRIQRIADSLAAVDSVAKAMADSAIVVSNDVEEESIQTENRTPGDQERGTMLKPAALGGLSMANLDYHYYVIVGAFKERGNAEKMLNIVGDAGYIGTIISFRNGLNAVGICQTDDRNKAFEGLEKAVKESFCPSDAWILVNE